MRTVPSSRRPPLMRNLSMRLSCHVKLLAFSDRRHAHESPMADD
jgi:hypothetical protein